MKLENSLLCKIPWLYLDLRITQVQFIEEESYIEIYAKPIKKVNDGYYRKGIATKLFYFHDGEEFEINSKDRVFKIPLSIIDYWSTSDGVILESSLIFTIKSQIGMKVHEKKANFLFLVNLCLI